jgi:hypothetical protein
VMAGFTALKHSTPRGVSFSKYEEMLNTHPYGDFITRKKRGKRIRQLVASVVFFDMDMGEEYTVEGIRYAGTKYNPVGNSAMALSQQQIGSITGTMVRYGILEKRTHNNLSYYKRLI